MLLHLHLQLLLLAIERGLGAGVSPGRVGHVGCGALCCLLRGLRGPRGQVD